MNPTLAPLLAQLKVNDWLFRQSIADLTAAEAARSPDGKINSPQWVAGHLAASRAVLAQLLGLTEDTAPFGGVFNRGAPFDPAAVYPPLAEITALFAALGGRIRERGETIPDAALAAPAPFNLPIADKTILGGIAFLSLHESYHAGQLGYLRRLLGHGPTTG
jgi:hypothetical protein